MHLRALALAFVLAGCPVAEPAAIIGTGELEWVSMEDDDELEVILGSQSGYHLLGSVRVAGIEGGDADDLTNPANPTTRFDVILEGSSILLTGEFTQGLERTVGNPEWTHEVIGRRAILDIEDDDDLEGETVLFSVEVTDIHGVVVSDEVSVEVIKHPLND